MERPWKKIKAIAVMQKQKINVGGFTALNVDRQ